MLKLREISNLIDFRTYVKEELADIEIELSELKFIYEKIIRLDLSNEIKEGSRVKVISSIGKPQPGRVISIKSGKYSVHRDGYAGTINLRKVDLENLSIGFEAEFERQIWVLENRKSRISGHLEDAEIPDILFKNKHNFIQVIDIQPKYPNPIGSYQLATFISSVDKLSYKLKIPTGLLHENEYYQIEMENGDISNILKTTKDVFDENFHNQTT